VYELDVEDRRQALLEMVRVKKACNARSLELNDAKVECTDKKSGGTL